MKEKQRQLREEVKQLLAQAEAADGEADHDAHNETVHHKICICGWNIAIPEVQEHVDEGVLLKPSWL